MTLRPPQADRGAIPPGQQGGGGEETPGFPGGPEGTGPFGVEEHPAEIPGPERAARIFRMAGGLLFHGGQHREVGFAAAAHRSFADVGVAGGAAIHVYST